ncbi:D-alanyl-D-alanine carboxypeptidase family protein [Pseudomarimonas salicorniae]|uniref:serine-type D-Ala-D-Ala carboxypeptidase n=1 Tax=Pseudomarimonas salicorniae TaxID=2933270 RepID=A0ABT0GHC2_9GAMM|nr:D-alanyl-D-alanine carboxypeptidase family protein [Lysobacter sp. CAU 1642]MCK7593935.1 D-alanyl-D-alanine carboxypeptidase [Lysobacter sp. CAU 1642]
MLFHRSLQALLVAGSLVSCVHAQVPTPTPQPTPVPVPTAQPVATPIPPAPTAAGKAHVLLDYETGQVLAEHNAREPLHPASLTKIMTTYVVAAEVKAGKVSLDDEVHISETAWREGGAGTDGSFSGLAVNSKVKLGEVLRGLVIQSGNDASIALAEHVAGSEAAFANLMNEYARQLGMAQSNFVNAHGLTAEGHTMSALDVALLSRALIRDFPEHYALHAIKEFTYNGIRQFNRNGLLWKDASVDGIKTGHTSAAGYCLAASAQRDGQRLISVVMGIEGSRKEGFRLREEGNLALLNWGFRFFETHTVYTGQEVVAEPAVWKGEQDTLPLGVAEPLKITLPRGRYADLEASMAVPAELVAPFEAGQQVGSIRLSLDDKLVAEVPLVTRQAVAEGGFFKRMNDSFWMWWESD